MGSNICANLIITLSRKFFLENYCQMKKILFLAVIVMSSWAAMAQVKLPPPGQGHEPVKSNPEAKPLSIKKTSKHSKEEVLAANNKKRAYNLFKEGVKHYNNKSYEKAIASFRESASVYPANAKVYYNLGKIYQMQGDNNLAKSYYMDAVKYDPNDSASLVSIGIIYFNQNNFPKALEYYNKALKVAPHYGMAYYNRGTIVGMNKQYDKAADDLTKAINLGFETEKVYVNRGLAYFYSKKTDKACKDWKKAASMGSADGQKAFDAYCTKK